MTRSTWEDVFANQKNWEPVVGVARLNILSSTDKLGSQAMYPLADANSIVKISTIQTSIYTSFIIGLAWDWNVGKLYKWSRKTPGIRF